MHQTLWHRMRWVAEIMWKWRRRGPPGTRSTVRWKDLAAGTSESLCGAGDTSSTRPHTGTWCSGKRVKTSAKPGVIEQHLTTWKIDCTVIPGRSIVASRIILHAINHWSSTWSHSVMITVTGRDFLFASWDDRRLPANWLTLHVVWITLQLSFFVSSHNHRLRWTEMYMKVYLASRSDFCVQVTWLFTHRSIELIPSSVCLFLSPSPSLSLPLCLAQWLLIHWEWVWKEHSGKI